MLSEIANETDVHDYIIVILACSKIMSEKELQEVSV